MKIAIIGGGIVGCSTAYYLSSFDPSIEIAIFDPLGIAESSSGWAGGLLSSHFNDDADCREMSKFGFQLVKDLADAEGWDTFDQRPVEVWETDCEFVTVNRGGGQMCLEKSQGLEHIGDKTNCAQLDPKKLTKFLKDKAVQNNSNLKFQKEKLIQIHKFEDRINLNCIDESFNEQSQNFDKITICTGQSIDEFFDQLDLPQKIDPIKVNILIQDQSEQSSVRIKYKDFDDMIISNTGQEIQNRPNSTLQINGYDDKYANNDSEDQTEYFDKLNNIVKSTFPDIALNSTITTGTKYVPHCNFGIKLGQVDSNARLHVNFGHGCWGILNGPACGYVAAHQLVGIKFDEFGCDKFRPMINNDLKN